MKKRFFVMFALATVLKDTSYGQSVAETLGALDNRLNSPLVLTRSDKEGGQLYVFDSSQKQTSIQLRTDNSGGNIDLYPRSGGKSLYLGTRGTSGEIYLYSPAGKSSIELGTSDSSIGYLFLKDPTGEKKSSELNTQGLFIWDSTGTKQVAYFGKTTEGTAGLVSVNGVNVHDYAEVFDFAGCNGLNPGSVVAASSDGKGIKLSGKAYDPAVVGVISGAGAFQPGMQIGSRKDGSSNLPVAVSGQVYVRVSVEGGAIAVGDLLVSSSVAGIAMRGADEGRLKGTVIGKALEPYVGHKDSLIRMLVMNR